MAKTKTATAKKTTAKKTATKKQTTKRTMKVPPFAVRKQLREATLAVGRTKTATKTQTTAKAKKIATTEALFAKAVQLRKDGLSFRAMEEKMFGKPGSGTRAFNVFNRAQAAAKASTKAAAKTPTAKTAKAKTTKARGSAVRPVITKTAPNGAQVIA